MKELLNITKALADENRIRILNALKSGELCVCQMISLLELAPSTVSKHVSILRQAGLLESRKDGRWVFYRLSNDRNIKAVLKWLTDNLKDDKKVARDNQKLEKILQTDPEIICRNILKK